MSGVEQSPEKGPFPDAVAHLRRFPATEGQRAGIEAAIVWLEIAPEPVLCAEEHPDNPDRTCTRTAWDCDGDHAFSPGQDGPQ